MDIDWLGLFPVPHLSLPGPASHHRVRGNIHLWRRREEGGEQGGSREGGDRARGRREGGGGGGSVKSLEEVEDIKEVKEEGKGILISKN